MLFALCIVTLFRVFVDSIMLAVLIYNSIFMLYIQYTYPMILLIIYCNIKIKILILDTYVTLCLLSYLYTTAFSENKLTVYLLFI